MKTEETNETNANNEINHLANVHSGQVEVAKEEVKKEEFDTNALAKVHEQSTDESSVESSVESTTESSETKED